MISGKNTLSLLKIARLLGLTGILDSAKSTTSCNEKCGLLLSGTFVSFWNDQRWHPTITIRIENVAFPQTMRPILTFSENNIITLSGPFFTSVRISLIKPQFDTSPAVSGLGYQRRQGIGMIGMVCMKLKICSTGFHNSEIMIRAMSLHVQNLFKEQNGGSNIPYQKGGGQNS